MKRLFKRIIAAVMCGTMVLSLSACGEEKKPVGNIGDVSLMNGDVYAVIKIMDYGEITAKLFPEVAPASVAKFTELAERGFYDMKTIHRVIDNYAIQGGSLNGDGTDGEIPDADYIPLETSDYARHFYGALCFAANSKGSFSQFCIVDNNKPQDIAGAIASLEAQLSDEAIVSRLTDEDKAYYTEYLNKLKKIHAEVVEKYNSKGGLYYLDGTETVFGQVIDGYSVLEAKTASEVVTGNAIDDERGISSKPIYSIVIETVEIIRIQPEETEKTTKATKKTTTTTTTQVVAETLITTTAPETSSETTTQVPLNTLVSIG
ncbi:MAG: peptidylprolyl isomerase [Oscillospiraceae bacterium]|nr:peptidylprolyl isomerase [Oscillospiraceae bacterium]